MTSPPRPSQWPGRRDPAAALLARVAAARHRADLRTDLQLATTATAHITDPRDLDAASLRWLGDHPLAQYDHEARALQGLPDTMELRALLERAAARLRGDLVALGHSAHDDYWHTLTAGGVYQMPATYDAAVRDDDTHLRRCADLVDYHLGDLVEQTRALAARIGITAPALIEGGVTVARTHLDDIAGLLDAVPDGPTLRPVYVNATGPVTAARIEVYDRMHAALRTPGYHEEVTRIRLLLAAPATAAEAAYTAATRVFTAPVTRGADPSVIDQHTHRSQAAAAAWQPAAPTQPRRR